MTNKYLNIFTESKDIESLKKLYRKLIIKNHPDRGGSKEEAQLINTAYEQAYKVVENKKDSKEKNNFKKATKEDIQRFIKIFDKLLKMEGLEIDIVGDWLWLSGNTFTHKEEIKKLNFRWSRKHKKWYWYEGIQNKMKKRGTKKNFKQITDQYGLKKVNARLAIA